MNHNETMSITNKKRHKSNAKKKLIKKKSNPNNPVPNAILVHL